MGISQSGCAEAPGASPSPAMMWEDLTGDGSSQQGKRGDSKGIATEAFPAIFKSDEAVFGFRGRSARGRMTSTIAQEQLAFWAVKHPWLFSRPLQQILCIVLVGMLSCWGHRFQPGRIHWVSHTCPASTCSDLYVVLFFPKVELLHLRELLTAPGKLRAIEGERITRIHLKLGADLPSGSASWASAACRSNWGPLATFFFAAGVNHTAAKSPGGLPREPM